MKQTKSENPRNELDALFQENDGEIESSAPTKGAERRNRDELLKEFLADAAIRIFKEEEYDAVIKRMEEIYTEEFRHKYSEITAYLTYESGLKRECLDTIAENMRHIYESGKIKSENLKNSIFKLFDHVSLERVRLNDILKFKDNFREKVDNFNEEINNAKAELKDSQKNYITILGIFAAIILAFVGGLTFSTSVLQNVHNIGIYRLAFAVFTIGFFISSILSFLFGFIKNINSGNKYNKEGNEYSPIFIFSIVMCILMILTFITAAAYEETHKKDNNPINLFPHFRQ